MGEIMKAKATTTKADIIVASGCVIFLLMSLGGSGSCVRRRAWEQSERAVCLSNLKQLTLGWLMYADENDDKIVNGMAGKDREQDGIVVERAWTGRDWADGYEAGAQLPQQSQEQAIGGGALFPYLRNVPLYRCPRGVPEQMRTYSIVDSMNGVPRPRTQEDKVWMNKRMDIRRPGHRIVFVDVGRATPDSFAVHYDKEQWWALPPVRHGDGTNFSFADGHSEHRTWKASETVELGKSVDRSSSHIDAIPQTPEGKEDLHRFQQAVWGKLGYTPGS
jgi:prepilin-type processing-associated H-X9-DG protein